MTQVDWCYRLDKYVYCLQTTLDIFKDTQHSDIIISPVHKVLPYGCKPLWWCNVWPVWRPIICDSISTCMFQWLQLSEGTKWSHFTWIDTVYSDWELDIEIYLLCALTTLRNFWNSWEHGRLFHAWEIVEDTVSWLKCLDNQISNV